MLSDKKINLNERLKYYEIIEINRRIEKRGIVDNNISYNKQQRLTFRAFNRFFDIYLTPKKGILHANFKCREIDGYGYEKLCTVNPDEYFGGHLHVMKAHYWVPYKVMVKFTFLNQQKFIL
uniref:Bm1210, isoform c n=1 Tax=Brugia malayi TaxID=6279 RepID=A0A1I9G6K6_BRUMA|nr:Bm1210, isoform c [Brugia malayi]